MRHVYSNEYSRRVSAILLVFLIIAIAAMVVISKPAEPTEDTKTITIEVIFDGTSTTHTISTAAAHLDGALLESSLVKGEEGPYGLFITEVSGRKADESKQEWWCITKNGEQMFTSAATEVLEDGNKYELTLFIGW